jgi:hypothetical protein
MNFFRSRSKSRTRQQEPLGPSKLPLQPSYSVNVPYDGIPVYSPQNRQRSNSYVAPIASTSKGVYYTPVDQYHQEYSKYPQQAMSAGYSPQMPMMMQQPAYYYAQGHVVHHIPQNSGYDSSPQSQYRDSHGRGRPRSNTSTAAREKLTMSSNAPVEAVRVPLAGYVPGPPSHESQKSVGIFGSLVNAVRSRSKSRERDALFSAGHPKPTASSRPSGDSRGRPQYDLQRQKQMLSDVDAEISRRLEKDLRLQDLEDPYRPIRRDRSRSFESTRSRERTERRNRDIDPDVQLNTRYNAKALAYAPERPSPGSRMRSEQIQHSSGYHTDAQPSMLRRSSTTTAHPKSSRSSQSMAPKGWFNNRGDQLVGRGQVICQPRDREYQPCFATYPPVGTGYGDSSGNIIDMEGRLIKRVG